MVTRRGALLGLSATALMPLAEGGCPLVNG